MQQGPKALTDYILKISKDKENKPLLKMILQGILAGSYIAIGAIGYFKIAGSMDDHNLASFLGALVFPVGIIAVLLMQAELFTSNCLIMTARYEGKIKLHKILKILTIILISNLIGSILIAELTNVSGIFDGKVMELVIEKAIKKAHMPVGKLFMSSILCNIIVCTGICLAYSCKEEITKIVVLWLAITVFVLSGTEHVVANMYYLFTAYFGGAQITLLEILYNLAVSAVGNFIGGGVLIAGSNYLIARQQ